MVLPQRLWSYPFFFLSSSYYDVWFVVGLLRRDFFSCYHRLIVAFDLSSTCYDVMFFVVLLKRFIFIDAIQTSKTDSISQIYQIMVIDMLNNRSHKYFSYYIIKFVGFITIYYIINLNIVSSLMNFSNLYIGSI